MPQQSSNSNGTTLPSHGKLQKSLSFAFTTPSMVNETSFHPNCQTPINYPERSYSRCDMYTSNSNNHHPHNHVVSMPYANGLNSRSRSVPEGLAQPNGDINWNNRLCRSQSRQQQHMHVLEQLTTTVWPKIHQNLILGICVFILEGIVALFIS